MLACEAADRVATLTAAIDADGPTLRTAQGPRAHPALRDELANRAFIGRTLQKLGVIHEPVGPIGRPSRGFGWRPDDD